MVAEKAKQNLKLSQGRGQKGCQKSDKVIESIDTKKKIAKTANISHDTIHKVEKISTQGIDEPIIPYQ